MSQVRDWSEKLPRPIKVKGRRALLKTRLEAAEYFLNEISSTRQNRKDWKIVANALNNGAPIKQVQHYLIKALQADGQLG